MASIALSNPSNDPIAQGYGLTETCVGAIFSEIDDTSVGRVGSPPPCSFVKMTSVKRCRNLSNKERLHLFQELLKEFNGRKLNHGAIKKYAKLHSLNTKAVASIWKLGNSFITSGASVDVSNKRANRVGRKRIEIDPEKVKRVDLRYRETLAGLANALSMSKTMVYRRFKEGQLRRHSNAIKPTLTEQNKKGRLEFCISMIDAVFLNGNRLMVNFAGMFDHVVIDEKWFFMKKDAEHYYLTNDEDEPYRTCQSKRFITKVMFLAAVARPRYDMAGDCIFDGKIGIFLPYFGSSSFDFGVHIIAP